MAERQGRAERRAYHHGDLRKALLEAAEAELAEKGIEAFTLRGCAKRAGVSHAAPAHHFTDANGLLTALAEVGFRRFVETQRARQAEAEPSPAAQMQAAGLGYIAFAMANPALFRLIFSSRRADFSDPGLEAAATEAFAHLVQGVTAIGGKTFPDDQDAVEDVMATWAIVHGLADLLLSERMKALHALPEPERMRALKRIISRALPVPDGAPNPD